MPTVGTPLSDDKIEVCLHLHSYIPVSTDWDGTGKLDKQFKATFH